MRCVLQRPPPPAALRTAHPGTGPPRPPRSLRRRQPRAFPRPSPAGARIRPARSWRREGARRGEGRRDERRRRRAGHGSSPRAERQPPWAAAVIGTPRRRKARSSRGARHPAAAVPGRMPGKRGSASGGGGELPGAGAPRQRRRRRKVSCFSSIQLFLVSECALMLAQGTVGAYLVSGGPARSPPALPAEPARRGSAGGRCRAGGAERGMRWHKWKFPRGRGSSVGSPRALPGWV